jgi:phage gpG-like protein
MARGFATTIAVEGLEKALAALRKIRDLGGDISPFMVDAKDILVKSTLERFRTGKGPGGIPWKPTKRQSANAVGPYGPNREAILVRTGDLRGSIRGVTGPNYVEVGSDGLKNPVKALANQFGSNRQTVVVRHKRRQTTAFGALLREPVEVTVRGHGRITNLPARPFVGIDEEDKVEVKAAWQERIIRTFRQ